MFEISGFHLLLLPMLLFIYFIYFIFKHSIIIYYPWKTLNIFFYLEACIMGMLFSYGWI